MSVENRRVAGQGLGIVALATALYILWQIRQILLLIFTAVVLATAANSFVRRVQRLDIPRTKAILVTLSLVTMAVIIFVGLIVPPFVAQFQELIFEQVPQGIDKLWDSIPQWIDNLILRLPEAYGEARNALEMLKDQVQGDQALQIEFDPGDWSSFLSVLPEQAAPIFASFFENFFGFFNNALVVALQLLLVIVLTMMLLASPRSYRQAFLLLFPSFYRRRADSILTQCEVSLGNWFVGITVNSIFVGVCSGIGLSFLQVDLALAHALLAGLLNFIPNIGPALSVVFPLSVAIQDPSGLKISGIIILYVIIQQLESYWVAPTVMARQVSLLPALTLIAQIFFATVFGILGLILALPLAVVSKVWIQELLIRDVLDQWQVKA
jgi:predicted PurR-regulated permease PerM